MSSLNYKHLRYFWMVAKTGSIAQAATGPAKRYPQPLFDVGTQRFGQDKSMGSNGDVHDVFLSVG